MSIQISSPRTLAVIGVLAAVLLGGVVFSSNFAEEPVAENENKPDEKDAGEKDSGDKDAEKEAEAYAVPDGTPEELVKFIEEIGTRDPMGSTREEIIPDIIRMQQAIIKAADKLLAGKSTSEQAILAINAKIGAMTVQAKFVDDRAQIIADRNNFIGSLQDDKRPKVLEVARFYQLQLHVRKFHQHFDEVAYGGAEVDEKLIATLAKDMGDFLTHAKKLEPGLVGMVMGVAGKIERLGETKPAAEIYRIGGEVFSKSDDKEIAAISSMLAGAARRLSLIGKPVKVFGNLVDGTKVNWDDYKGKVVLIDFWATWCGPCIREIPNVLENYERYHKRGFEVLAVSLDDDQEKVSTFMKERKIPWKTIFHDKTDEAASDDSMVTYYGVFGIPSVILVDRQGKAVSLSAHGPELGELLAKYLGDADGDADGDDGGKKKSTESNNAGKK